MLQGNYAKFLKHLHSEQVAKLQAKNQHECDLLEDIRWAPALSTDPAFASVLGAHTIKS